MYKRNDKFGLDEDLNFVPTMTIFCSVLVVMLLVLFNLFKLIQKDGYETFDVAY